MENLKKFFKYFKKNKKSFIIYSSLSLIVGFLELFGVALTYPFVIKLLSGSNFRISSLLIGLTIIFLFIAKNIFMIFYTYLRSKFTKALEIEVNLKFMQFFLSTHYCKTYKISFAKKANILNFLIPNVINNFILRILNLSVNAFIFITICSFLIIKFPIASVVTIICASVLIYCQNKIFKPMLLKTAEKQKEASVVYNQRSNEALINLKSVKISGKEHFFFNNYKKATKLFNKNSVKIDFLNSIPPYIIEPCIIILLFLLMLIISIQSYQEPNKLLASFALIVTAIFRLTPTIARIQVNINGINSAKPIVEELLSLCEEYKINNVNEILENKYISFNDKIELKNITFGYESKKPILKNINLTIKKGEFVGIAGLSGCGKTTLADIISGLFIPQAGKIFVDNKELNGNLKIGYIPQDFSTISASIKDNITYGNKNADINKVIKALKYAQLYDFIIQNYENGIDANPFIDSQGLSQGQKQRLAIARALYMEPDILILDEATSSLDLKIEDEICQVLNSLKGHITIIAIAHRLSTLKNTDKIAFMKNGSIENIAPFEELISENQDFKNLTELA